MKTFLLANTLLTFTRKTIWAMHFSVELGCRFSLETVAARLRLHARDVFGRSVSKPLTTNPVTLTSAIFTDAAVTVFSLAISIELS